MAKGKSWGSVQEAYVNSPLADARSQVAQLTGVLHRTAGLLGVEANVDALSEWCAREETTRREIVNGTHAGGGNE